MRKNNSGFTLVELLVTIAAAALVLVAVSSLLLTGLRLEGRGSETVAAQRDSRVVLTMLENIAAEGQIDKIKYEETDWEIQREIAKKADGTPEYETILSYKASEQAIKGKDNGLILDEVAASAVNLNEDRLLTCYIEFASGENYESSVYCRVGTTHQVDTNLNIEIEEEKLEGIAEEKLPDGVDHEAERYAFLVTLLHEYGSTGKIQDDSEYTVNVDGEKKQVSYGGLYYSQWFAMHKAQENFAKWGRGTPWCACYLSWALAMQRGGACELSASVGYMLFDQFVSYEETDENKAKLDALVKLGYAPDEYKSELFDKEGEFHLPSKPDDADGYTPIPGDLVFFERADNDDCPDHVGCVLAVEGDTLYTIEGNNNNRVGIFSYQFDNEFQFGENTGTYRNNEMFVVGYGQLNWTA